MAKAWKDVIASPQYQALTEEQKAQAQAQYFDEVVAPKAGDKADSARQQFFSAYPPPVFEKNQELWKEQQGRGWLYSEGFVPEAALGVVEAGRGAAQ
ncbi:lytic transglycosylase domain-containing protein, partial [Escherichia coli]